ncbi:MAG: hypothetical protein ACXVB9_21145, partial [Bdellovibrionota bacterium]
MKISILVLAMAACFAHSAGAADKCRTKALDAAEAAFGADADETNVKTVQAGQTYEVGVDDKQYSVVFANGCSSKPTVKETGGDEEERSETVQASSHFGQRCGPGKKYHDGSCCEERKDGSLDCPTRPNPTFRARRP